MSFMSSDFAWKSHSGVGIGFAVDFGGRSFGSLRFDGSSVRD